LSREYQEILPVEAATPRTARSGGGSGMLHRTTVRRVDLIEGIVSAGLGDRTASDLSPRERAEAIVIASALSNLSNAQAAPTSRFARDIRVRWRVSTSTSSHRDSCNAAAHSPCVS
jgi:hypothetical protein